tara:strand:- start:135 stop:458 length:324 start_codon:yes stop_codon:yes gene_type:complete
MDPKDIRIKPRCLTFQPKSYHKPAAYTADGFMLPCCWLDDPKNDHALENEFHMKDDHLALKNVNTIEEIYGSKEWAHFFDTLINNPSCAMKQCQYKCGNREKDTYKK